MPDRAALINVPDISKPATVLIEKISDAVGGIYRPYQIRRIAQAEADAETIRAVAQIERRELCQRAAMRFLAEEAKKQANMESITQQAIPQLEEGARPETVEDDWLANFFEKCRLVSDAEMQSLWAKLLAGEVNAPGRYSKRTLTMVASLDKSDADVFRNLCAFAWLIGNTVPIIQDVNDPIYSKNGVTFGDLKHLDEIGLISFETLTKYSRTKLGQDVVVMYHGEAVLLHFAKPSQSQLNLGHVVLSKTGEELAPICGAVKHPEFKEYILGKWRAEGVQCQPL